MNPQSYGEVTLASANPSDAPNADPKLISHPYDRRVLIEGVRKLMDYFDAPVWKKSAVKLIGCPRSRSDEDIWVGSYFLYLFFQEEGGTHLWKTGS